MYNKMQEDENKTYISIYDRRDGFGAQYQNIVFAILYAEFNGYEYIHNCINIIEHNYNKDENFVKNMNNFINIKKNYLNASDVKKGKILKYRSEQIYPDVENNIDNYTNNNPSFNKIKNCFWEDKNKDFYKNNKFNVAVHIRRTNQIDTSIENRIENDLYYLKVMQNIREKYNDKNLLFHIYSQGDISKFECYINDDVVFHLDEDLMDTFIGLVAAEALVTSKSSLSYTAAILSEGEIYYLPFWHKPKKDWIIL